MLYNIHRAEKAAAKDAMDFAFGDFEKQEQTAEDHKTSVDAIVKAFGAKPKQLKKENKPIKKGQK